MENIKSSDQKSSKETKIQYTDFNPDVIPVDTANYQDEFLYAKSIERINAKDTKGFATVATTGSYNDLSDKPTIGGRYYANATSYNSTGSKSITGVGFTPTMVRITANATGTGGVSIGTAQSTRQQVIYWYADPGSLATASNTSQIIAVVDTGGNKGIASFTSFDADGFTINFTTASTTIVLHYECYG